MELLHAEEEVGTAAGRKLLAGGGDDAAFTFEDVVFLMISLLSIWAAGRVCKYLGAPSLVGQIIIGIIVGPNLTELCPQPNAMSLIGEVGLCLLVLEAGLDVDIAMIKKMGMRAAGIAVSGSLVPLGIGTGLAAGVNLDWKQALVVGTSLSPTSVGIALNVLNSGKILTTETGQLIVAAAILDDIIALVLLSELQALSDPSAWAFMKPLVVAGTLLVGIGGLAIYVVPQNLEKIMHRIPEKDRENFILLLIFLTAVTMIPGVHYAGGSHLLGAFLAGLCFCSDHYSHEAWMHQVKRVMSWLVTVFFACTVGFAIPIKELFKGPVVANASIFFIAILGKIATGLFAQEITLINFFTIGFSMSAWGEFAFVVASTAKAQGIIEKDVFSAVVLAVLVSVIFGPLFLKITLNYRTKALEAAEKAASMAEDDECGDEELHPLYFIVVCKCRGRPGQHSRLLRAMQNLELFVLDLRVYHPKGQVGSVELGGNGWNVDHMNSKGCTTTMAVRDLTCFLPNDLKTPQHKDLFGMRIESIKTELYDVLEDSTANVELERFIPGMVDGHMVHDDFSKQKSHTNGSLEEHAVVMDGSEKHDEDQILDQAGPSNRLVFAHADLELRRRYAMEFKETAGQVMFKRISVAGAAQPSRRSIEMRARMSVSNTIRQSNPNQQAWRQSLEIMRRNSGQDYSDGRHSAEVRGTSQDVEMGMGRSESVGDGKSRPRHSIEMAIGASSRYSSTMTPPLQKVVVKPSNGKPVEPDDVNATIPE